jgi:hypothetical protein
MKTDYTYCANEDTCLHRRACLRWLGNYSDEEVKELYTENSFVDEVDDTKCVPNYKDINCTNDFHFLDRFRLSDGSEFKNRYSNT